MDAARDFYQVLQGACQTHRRVRQLVFAFVSRRHRGLDPAQLHACCDELLLHAVVQIAFDPAARLVCRGDDPSTRSGELLPAPFELGCPLDHLRLEVVAGPAKLFFCFLRSWIRRAFWNAVAA